MEHGPSNDERGLGVLQPVPEMFLDWDLTNPSAWVEHAPFMGWLIVHHRPRTFVELGTHWGLSYFAACAAAKSVGLQMESMAVDTWEGEEHAGTYDERVYNYVRRYNDEHFGHQSQLFRGYFDDAAQTVADGHVDLLHIDGLHTYEAVRHDFETWRSKLSTRGVVLFHDIAERQATFGVHRLWAEVSAQYPSFRFLHGHGLGVLAVGSDIGPDIAWLCAQDDQPAGDEIRLMFRELGRSVEVSNALIRTQQTLAEVAAESAFRDSERARAVAELESARAEGQRLRAEVAQLSNVPVPAPEPLTGRARRWLARERAALDLDVSAKVKTRARRLTGRVSGRPADDDRHVLDERHLVFDADYYLAEYPDVAVSGMDPWRHYVRTGSAERRRPSALFDPAFYLRSDPSLAAQQVDPLTHYLAEGWRAGLDPIPEFDTSWYLEQNPDVLATGINPLVHYLTVGAAEGRNPGPAFDTAYYLRSNPDVAGSGANPLIHYLTCGRGERRAPLREPDSPSELLAAADPATTPLRVLPARGPGRIVLVTDTVRPDSLYGGAGTEVFLAAAWSERSGRSLRIVSRRGGSESGRLGEVLAQHGLHLAGSPDVVEVPEATGDYLEVTDDDVFLTTSWSSTHATAQSLPAARIVYLVREDERELYGAGFDRLLAGATMDRDDLSVVVSTQGLLDHLVSTGLESLRLTATSFEPSFAAYPVGEPRVRDDGMGNLLFHAQPDDDRALFLLGMQVLDRVIETGVLDTSQWRIHLVGRNLPRVRFCDGSMPETHDGRTWSEYRDLLRGTDLGLSLRAGAHPAYPALELAAAGAVVVTNSWPGKPATSGYGDSILEAPATVDGLASGLAQGIEEVRQPTRTRGLKAPYTDSWAQNLDATVQRLLKISGDV